MRINDWSSDVCSSDLSTEAPYNDRPKLLASYPMSQKQWIAGINAVSAAIEHDADNVREVLIEAGAKNPRLAEIESNARRFGLDARRVNQQALAGVVGNLRHQGVVARSASANTWREEELQGLVLVAAGSAPWRHLAGEQAPHHPHAR